MKKTINRLPDSELDIMLVLWKYEPPMTRIEIERVVNEKKALAPPYFHFLPDWRKRIL